MIRKLRKQSHRKVDIRGCIDIGSSYFRLLVVEGVTGGGVGALPLPSGSSGIRSGDSRPGAVRAERSGFQGGLAGASCYEDKRYVGWGDDLYKTGRLSARSISAAQLALDELIAAARERNCSNPVLVGTNALRAAANSREVVSRLEQKTSLPVHVLSARGEAAMGLRGASLELADDRAALLLDPGGTSTEISWGESGEMVGFISIPLGTHRIARGMERFPHTYRGMRTGMLHLTGSGRRFGDKLTSIRSVSGLSGKGSPPVVLATGGTAVSLAVCKSFMRDGSPKPPGGDRLTVCDINLIGRRMCGLFDTGRHRALPLERERTELLIPGLLLMKWIAAKLRITHVRVTSRDLRWGVVASGGVFGRVDIIAV